MTNYEWLLAMSGEERQAWFDAPHDAGEASMMCVNAFIAEHSAHSKEQAPSVTTFSDNTQNCTDSREQLEADIDRWAHSFNIADERHHSTRFYEDLRGCMLDIANRQAAITERECANTRVNFTERMKFVSRIDELKSNRRAQAETIRRLSDENDELQEQVDELQEQVMEKHYELKDANAANKRQSEKIEGVCRLNDELQRKLDNLAHDLRESERKCSELQAELEKQTTDYANVIAAQIKQMNELAHDLAKSERLREEMREELSIAYDHAHDLLARRDRGLA